MANRRFRSPWFVEDIAAAFVVNEAIRRAIQNSQASLRNWLRYSTNPKTVAKCRRRCSVCDSRMGPTEPRSTVLGEEEEA